MSYEGGRMTVEFSAIDEASAHRIVARLLQAGLSVDPTPALPSTAVRAASAPLVLTVRAS